MVVMCFVLSFVVFLPSLSLSLYTSSLTYNEHDDHLSVCDGTVLHVYQD